VKAMDTNRYRQSVCLFTIGFAFVGVNVVCGKEHPRVWPSERTTYRDEVTDAEVWRLTTSPSVDISTHRTQSCWPPDGSKILFRSRREGRDHFYLMEADGSKMTRLDDLHGATTYAAWSRSGRETVCTRSVPGSGFGIYMIDAHTFAERRIAGPFDDKLGGPGVSPDGTQVLFSRFVPQPEGQKQDVVEAWRVNVDGSDLAKFEGTMKHGGYGWVPGRMDILRMKSARKQHICQADGSQPRLLADGGHEVFSPDGRQFLVCDPKGGDPSKWLGKCSAGIYDVDTGERRDLTTELVWVGTHPSFSPDGQFVAIDNAGHDYPGAILIARADGTGPIRVLCYHRASWESGHITHPTMHWSPDGTKIVFVSDKDSEDKTKGDLYLVVVKQPDAPTDATVRCRGDQATVTWQPARLHNEIKEYVVLRSVPSPREGRRGRKLDRTGVFEPVGTAPVVSTCLAAGGLDESATEIPVHSTEGFPESGLLEVAGNHALGPHEVIQYQGKTATSFLNCQRGAEGSGAASHWGETRVWSQSANQFVDTFPPTERRYYYVVRAREHSGLESAYSRITSAAFVKEE